MHSSSKTKTLVLTAVMSALLAVVAPFTLPLGPVPFTLAIFAIFLAGALLPPLSACAAVGVYIVLGAVGLPVFSAFGAGVQVLAGPTGGFIAGYVFIALATSLGIRHLKHMGLHFLCSMLGLCICYLLGTLWFMHVTSSSFISALMICVVPFALLDILKSIFALLLARSLRSRLSRIYS